MAAKISGRAAAPAADEPVKLAPLGFGEPTPFFFAKSDVNPRFSFNAAAGRWMILAMMGTLADPTVKAAHDIALSRRDLFEDMDLAFFGVVLRDDGSVRSSPGYRYFFDEDLAVSKQLRATDGKAYAPIVYLLDRALRVVKVEPINRMAEMIALAQQLMADEAPTLLEQNAPVMTIPRIFEPGLCEALIRYYDEHGGQVSGFMREVDGQTVLVHDDTHKRRKDVMVDDELMRKAIRQRIERRLLPMIERAYGWKATQLERYLVACYGEEDNGFFRAHRDNTTAGTAHRKFAVSINLNADYDGGMLRFPEFGPRTYKPPVGGATVFNCSLLHEATPVTRGQRYAFLPFLYDDEGVRIRQANMDKVKLPEG